MDSAAERYALWYQKSILLNLKLAQDIASQYVPITLPT